MIEMIEIIEMIEVILGLQNGMIDLTKKVNLLK